MNDSCDAQEELNMVRDIEWKGYFSDDERYADIINGLACQGRQVITKADLHELDTQTGFWKDSRLYPVVTFILYSGKEAWDGPESLHEILDFTDMPDELKEMVADYKIHLIEIRKLKDTSVFKTDIRQVFDFIRCSEDKKALLELVEKDDYYRNMEEDAFDVVSHYTNTTELVETKEYYGKDGRVDMCKAIKDLMEDSRTEGMQQEAERFSQLIILLSEQNRMDDLVRAAKDKKYQERLFREELKISR